MPSSTTAEESTEVGEGRGSAGKGAEGRESVGKGAGGRESVGKGAGGRESVGKGADGGGLDFQKKLLAPREVLRTQP